jgi:hypothetical protein
VDRFPISSVWESGQLGTTRDDERRDAVKDRSAPPGDDVSGTQQRSCGSDERVSPARDDHALGVGVIDRDDADGAASRSRPRTALDGCPRGRPRDPEVCQLCRGEDEAVLRRCLHNWFVGQPGRPPPPPGVDRQRRDEIRPPLLRVREDVVEIPVRFGEEAHGAR